MASQFVLAAVPGFGLGPGNIKYTDLSGNTVDPTPQEQDYLNRMYLALFPNRIQANAACELLARIIGYEGDVFAKGSTKKKNHAEENLLKDLAGQNDSVQATVYGMFVTLEPCHSGRYPGHSCRDFFQTGREFTAHYDDGTRRRIRGQFLPNPDTRHARYTPIFILEKQLAKGEKSALGSVRSFGQAYRSDMLMLNLSEIPRGYTEEYGRKMRWDQSEQQSAGAVTSVSVPERAEGQTGSRGMGGSGDRSQRRGATRTKKSKGKRRFFKFWRLFRK